MMAIFSIMMDAQILALFKEDFHVVELHLFVYRFAEIVSSFMDKDIKIAMMET